MAREETVIRSKDLDKRIGELQSEIGKEKNSIEKKRLERLQASLIETRREMTTYRATVNPTSYSLGRG